MTRIRSAVLGFAAAVSAVASPAVAQDSAPDGMTVAATTALRFCPFMAVDASRTLAQINPAQAFGMQFLQDEPSQKVWGNRFGAEQVVIIADIDQNQCSVTLGGRRGADFSGLVRSKLIDQGFTVDSTREEPTGLVEILVGAIGDRPFLVTLGHNTDNGNGTITLKLRDL